MGVACAIELAGCLANDMTTVLHSLLSLYIRFAQWGHASQTYNGAHPCPSVNAVALELVSLWWPVLMVCLPCS